MAWDGGYCDRCNNTGEIDCRCCGDLCCCGQGVIECPVCHGDSARPFSPGWSAEDEEYDDYDYEARDRANLE